MIWRGVCSEIIDDFLYLGSDVVAKDEEALTKAGITHVINCAADFSEDYFKDKGITYRSYHLKDNVKENIECTFYDAVEFMQNARKANGRVYVHCV